MAVQSRIMEEVSSLVDDLVSRLAELGEGEPYLEEALTKAVFRDLVWSVLERLDGADREDLADHLETLAELLHERNNEGGD